MKSKTLIDKLNAEKTLSEEQWRLLLSSPGEDGISYAAGIAREIAGARFGNRIYFRGIIEFTNFCRNDCLYCGIRRSNTCLPRYRLTKDEILECCAEGYRFGYRTFVLQGGEDGYFSDERMRDLVQCIRKTYPDCAITLSIGERSEEAYRLWYDAGANRYLMRHETADPEHYGRLHPPGQHFENRMRCLTELRDIGYQTGCGIMVGSPYQTVDCLVKDMVFMSGFRPQMAGIGPFIPHKDTPFRGFGAGSTEMTLFLLSLTRIMLPDVLLPATTALGTVRGDGRQLGVLAGCNVIMPNLSPLSVRKKYLLYDNKAGTENNAEQSVRLLERQMSEIGYQPIAARGDYYER